MILRSESLSFAYTPGEDVVKDLSLDVAEGEVVCVLGPNGAGKSTLLRLLAGITKPRTGAVSIGGDPIGSLSPRDRARRIALVPQSLYSLPDLSVEEFVRQGRYAYRARFRGPSPEDVAAITRALEDTELSDLTHRALDSLSGGQRQRALVARALAQEPRIVLVDEPTNSLDLHHRIHVFDVIARVGCEGRAALVVTHDMNLAAQYATRVVLIQDGAIVADGSVHDVLTPEVLVPVYGEALAFGKRFVSGWNEERPYVIPWRS